MKVSIFCGAPLVALGLSLSAHAVTSLNRISCQHNSVSGAGTDACSVYMSRDVFNTDSVTLSSNNPNAVLSASKVYVSGGHQTAGFSIAIAAVTTTQKAAITATFNGKSITYGITLNPVTADPVPDALSAIKCQASSFTSQGTDSCSVNLTSAATVNDTVTLTSSDANAVPTASVSIAKGSTTAAFSIAVAGVTTQQIATITAALGSSAVTDSLTLYPPSAPITHDVALSWSAPQPNGDAIAGYHVYRSAGSNTTNFSQISAPSTTNYVDSNVTSGSSYTYVIRSVDIDGVESSNSNTTVATIPTP